jgi:hypothetical protein
MTMKHLLADPAFPDIVGQWAAGDEAKPVAGANDNAAADWEDELSDPFLDAVARMEVAATRLW